jgi:glycogen debranching enzyme
VLPKDVLHVVRTLFLWRGTAYQRIRIQNHGDRPFEVRLVLAFASDFADLFEVRGMRRARRGTATAELSGAAGVALNYQALDGTRRRTMLQFEPVPERLSTGAASYAFELQPNESQSIYVSVKCDRGADENLALPFRKGLRAAFKEHRTANPWHDHHHHLEPDLQRGDVPLDGGPRDPDDRDAGGSLSLRRHPLVLDHVWPRRDHHGDADAVV